jgi:UDP-N-acetyl-2-amino-2-deoxyglucuronate dehydrogenase
MKKFALIGAAGYIAPRHMKAIRDTNNLLVAAMDRFDSVGIIDSYFPEASFFTEFERFDRHLDKLKRKGEKVDFVSICTPNYLHDAHIRFGLRNEADVICEKPMVLNPWNVEALKKIEQESGQKIYNILQLRHHPSIIALKEKIDSNPEKKYDIDLTYITSRGKWYDYSWKGELPKSGGIGTNIGIHFFDMLMWIFGGVKQNKVHIHQADCASGFLALDKANVRWFLSINQKHLPDEVKSIHQRTFRSIKVENEEIEFSSGFTDLHTVSYEHILSGKGFGIQDVEKSIQLAHDIRNFKPIGLMNDFHPFALKIQTK